MTENGGGKRNGNVEKNEERISKKRRIVTFKLRKKKQIKLKGKKDWKATENDGKKRNDNFTIRKQSLDN